jgi:hypothetical protein
MHGELAVRIAVLNKGGRMFSFSMRLRALPVSALILLLVGCAQIPKEELGKYSNAFEEVRGVTEILIDDFESAQKVTDQLKQVKPTGPAPRFPAKFNPQQFLSGAPRQRDIAARIAALDAVSNYNQALTGLAEGRGVESAKTTTSSLLGLAGMFAPQLKLAEGLVGSVVAAVERARTQAEFVRAYRLAVVDASCPPTQSTGAPGPQPAVAAGGAVSLATESVARCGPIIPAIFAYLMEDTRTYYETRVAFTNARRAQIRQPVRILGRQIDQLTGNFAAPSDAAFANEYGTLAAEYQQLMAQFVPTESFSFGAGKQPYDKNTHAQLTALMAALKVVGEQEQKLVDDLNAYHARLIDYVRLLDRTQSHLNDIGVALERPVNVDALAGRIAGVGAELRRNGADLQGAFLKLLVNE